MLADDSACVESDDGMVGKGLLDNAEGPGIVVGLGVGGYDDRSVEDDEIGIGGRQTVAFFIDGVGHGQRQEPIGLTLWSPEHAQFFLEHLEICELFV